MQKIFKRVLSVLLAVMMLLTSVPLSGLADAAVLDWFVTVADAADESETIEPATIVDSGTCGSNLIWEFYSDGTLVISGEGYMDDYSSSSGGCLLPRYSPWKDFEISTVIIKSGVTSIGKYAFHCSSLNSIAFEEGSQLINIWDHAFESCTELKEIKIPSSVEYICDSAFSDCLSLESVLFDKNSMLYGIDEDAFSYCSKLDEIEIPASVEYISDYAFFYCKNLSKITIYNPECVIYDSANTINQTTTIVGYPYSTSSTYANNYGHSFIELTCLHDEKSEIMGASATCTDDGYTDGVLCNICNIWIAGHEMIEASGHDYGEWIEINTPTCEETGKKERTCLNCDKVEQEIISTLGHSFESDWIVEKEASCTVNGLKTNFCTRCQSDVSETIFAQHIFDGDEETIQQLSCITDGIKIRTCSVCNNKGGYIHYTANDLPKCTGSNYTHNMNLTFNTFSIADADKMVIHFSANSELEKNYDKLYVYEGNTVDSSKLIGTYTGSLASTVITINSSSFTLKMTTDGSVTKHGFEIAYIDYYYPCEGYEVTKALGHDYVVDYTPYTCTNAGMSLKHCSRCDESDAPVKIAPRHVDFDNDGFCDFCFEPYVGVLDLVFVIDATGSMGDEVDVVKNSIQDYANRLDSSNIPYYIALIEFSDDSINTGQYNYYNIDLNFSSNISEITEGISNLSLKGGSNEPAYSALINGLNELNWGDKSVRRVILIGDETPWDEPSTTTGYRYRDALNSLHSKDVVLYSIATGGSDVAIFKRLATATEGSYYKSSTADEFAQVLTDIIDNIPETLHIHTYEETILEATCTKEGKTSFICTGCLKEISNHIEPLGHDYSEDFTVDLAPTCTKEGSKSKHCSRCDEKIEITTLESLGHNYVSERIEATDKLEEHTCYTCSRCKDSYIVLDPAEKLEGLLALAGTYKVSLSWLKAVEASVTGYNIYRKSIDEAEYTLIKTITSRNTTSFVDEDVTAGYEYLYIVTALKDKVEGYMCDPVSCIPNADEEAPRVYKLESSKSLNNVITGAVDFVVNAEDNIGVVKFELFYCVENSDDWKLISEYSGSSAKISFNTKSIDDGSYSFKAVAYDAVGNSGDGDIVKTYAVDNTGPEKVTGLTSKVIYASKATIAWQNVSDKDINHFILRRKTNSGYEIVSNSITGTLGYNLESLTPETEYTYSVAGVDHYGNIGEYSDDFTFVTVADTTAPVVSNVSPAPGRFNKVINFSAATEDDCNIYKIEVIASNDLNEWSVVAEKTFTDVKSYRNQSFSVSLDKFDEGNLFLAAVAYDNSGNSSSFGNESGYVQYVVDRSAPAAPKNVKATGNDRQIVVTWDKGVESDLGKYSVYRAQKENGEFTLVASNLAKLDYYDTSVVDGITYYYKISVNDSCGNVSDFSDIVFANLSEDNKKPVITSVGLGNGTVCGPSNKTIGVLAQDNKYIREIVVEYRQENDSTYTVLSKKTYTDNNYYRILEVDLPINLFNDGDKIYVRAYCTDTSGLVSDYNADSVITVDKTAPNVSNVNYTLNGSKYTLSWADNDESDISGYKVYYSKNGANYKVMATRGYTSYGTYSVSVTLDSGSYDIKLEAIDKVGNSKEYICPSIVIQGSENFKLEAKIDCPSYFEVGVEETISAGNSVSSEGIISYSWDFDDDTTANSKEINKRYSKLGNYKIKLTIEDAKGNVATATKNIVVKEREMLGTVKAIVVDASSKPVKNAEVYFGLGEENQQVVRTNSSGVAELVMSVGTHSIGALADTTKYLPAEVSANVIANRTTEITLTLVQKPLIDLELEYHEMSFEEILESGIDLSASANKQFISGTITVTYTTTGGSSTSTKVIEYVSTSDKIIDYTIKNDRPDDDDDNGNDDDTADPYVFTPVIINGGEDEKIVAVLVMPAEASFLKQFYDVTLYVTNNAESRFSISDCEASLSVPSGLTVIDSTPISSTITGGSTASASWIVRGDTKGEYYISANFSGNLDLFDKHVSASITSSDPLVVRGLDGITLRAVFNSMIKNNTLYYNFILENDSGYDIYAPNVDYQSIIDNLMIEAPKKDDKTEIVTECLGVSLINADDIAETFDVDKTFDVLHDGEKIKYEFKTSGLANDDVVGYYTEGTVDCLPQFKDHIIVEEDYIYSYDGEEEIVKYTEKYADVFENQNGVVLRFFDNSKLLEGKVDYLVGSVSGDVHSKLKNVTVEYGNGQVKHANEEFAAKYADVKGYDITIKSDGYRIKVIPAEAIEKWATYFSISQKLLVEDIYLEQDHKDGKPYITSAIGKENMEKGIKTYTDLMTSKLTVTGSVSCDIIIKADLSGGTNATYWLSQDEEHKISNNDGNFSAIEIHEIFDKDKDIYAYVITENNGKKVASEPLKLSVEIQELDSYTSNFLNETTISLISTKGQSMELSEDVPLVGGSTISANLLSFPIGVEIEGSKVKISFGCDIFSHDFVTLNESKKNKWFDFKAAVKKWEKGYEDAMKLYESSVFGPAVDVGKTFTLDFYGYLEGEIVNGSIVPIDMSASLKGAFKYKYTQQGAVYCIPAYCYVEAACAVAVKAAYARQIPDYNIPFDFGFVLTISPSLKLGAGAGIKDAISAGVFANGVIEYTNDFPNQHHKFKLTGTFGAEAAFFFLKWEKDLAEGTWTPVDDYYGDSKSRSVMMFSARNITSSSGNEEIFYSDADEAELVTRDYLTGTSEWSNAPITDEKIGATTGTLIESVYPNGENQIVQFGDKLMQVFIEDDANRDNYNFARLVYSVYDNNLNQWSNPKAVYDNGHFDSSAKLCVDENGNVHVLWQKLDTTFNSENGTVEEILKNGEIYYASYDETTDEFVDVKKLTDDAMYDSLPSICIEDNKVVAYWVKNNENDLLKAGANSLVRYEIDGESKTLVRELNYIADVTSCDGEVSVIYDTDGDTTTVNDWTIASYSSSNGDSILSEEIDNLSSVKYSDGTLYFATANEIGYFNDADEISYISKNVFSSRNFTVVNDSAFWIEDNSLMYSKFENNTWSAPVVIASDDGNMSNMSVAEIGDYAYVVYSSTEIKADEEGNESAGATNLKFIKVSQYVDLSVYLNLVDEYSILECREDNIELYVENNGNTTVEKIEVTLTDTLGNDVCVTSEVNLAPGSGKIVKLTYQPKEGYANTVLTVTVSAVSSSKEKTPSNNTIEEIIGLCDLLIENDSIDTIGDNYFLSAMISNSSLITAENIVVKTFLGSLESEPIGVKNFNTLAMGESLYANIPICKDNLIFDEDGSAKVYVVVSAASKESLSENNTICFVITNDDGKCGHPEKTLVSSEQATCISEGINMYVCDACGNDIYEKIPMLEHDIVIDEAIAPTCTKSGFTEGSHCTRCDNATVEQEIAPALDHDMITDEAVDPTCTETGLTKGSHCSRCDSATIEQEIIPALEHKIVVIEAVAPTCTETGLTEGVKCGTCGEILTEQTVVSTIDHTDNDGNNICDTCDFTFTGSVSPEPDTPDEPTDRDCNHLCHRSGFIGFIWKIVRFLQKLFGIQQYCDCGALHW